MRYVGGGCSCDFRPNCGHYDLAGFSMKNTAPRKKKPEETKGKKSKGRKVQKH